MIAIEAGEIFTTAGVIRDGLILVDGRRIRGIGASEVLRPPKGAQVIEAHDHIVAAGFMDLHSHGLHGHDVMGPGLAKALRAYPQYGVTSFMATTHSLPEGETHAALQSMAQIVNNPPTGARCLGIHVEGPHLSPAQPGMHSASLFKPLTWEAFESLQKSAAGLIRMITFAPEQGEAMRLIPRLRHAGAVPVIGHSDATYEQVVEAVSLGLDHAAHAFNAMRGFHHRQPGVVGAVLHLEQIFAELIADGVHVHPVAMSLLFRVKGIDHVVLISDSAPFAGLPPGEYQWGSRTVSVLEGRCQLEDGTLAGSYALIDTGVRSLVRQAGLSLEAALSAASTTPARSLGLDHKGRLAAGMDADVVVLDHELQPVLTMVEGEVMWQR